MDRRQFLKSKIAGTAILASSGLVFKADAKNLPTSIKINDEWVLPRGGTMEWLMTKGYVPHPNKKNIMVIKVDTLKKF